MHAHSLRCAGPRHQGHRPMGFVVESVYDAAGQLASSKDARGNTRRLNTTCWP
ncbi:hypothetical protein [Comamonas sp. JC664]|uniref:hypothetical protein n=1 Tax=Comamonas sp. JC664 TaxID=2801917 RepID=UPI003612DE9B